MMKKLIALFLALLLLCLSLTGCGTDEAQGDMETTVETTIETTIETTAEMTVETTAEITDKTTVATTAKPTAKTTVKPPVKTTAPKLAKFDPAKAGYTLSYSDEFNGKLDESVWSRYELTPRRGGYWSPDQVRTEKGNLVIETGYVDNGKTPAAYHSGIAFWHTKRSAFGYYEVRAKLTNTRGVWSAIWLQPDDMGKKDGSARDGAEIDIMESAIPNRWQTNIHYDGYTKSLPKSTEWNGLYDVYHTYALDWKKDSMRFYIDGQLYQEVTDPNMIPQVAAAMQLSTEIAGKINNDGVPVPTGSVWGGCGELTDNAPGVLPSQYLVDYVRVYDNGDLAWS